ncbi:MAG: non-canonical purine NTP pyrophosphatase [Myxococcota bacterium]
MSTHTLYVSTRNAHKLSELRAMLAAIGSFELIPAADAEVPDVEEIGETFLDNAVLKAAAAFKVTGGVCLADDSGLTVDALDGAPGVFSARFSGEGATTDSNNAHLLAALEATPEERRGAAFVCQLALIVPADQTPSSPDVAPVAHRWVPEGAVLYALQGRVEGRILREARGAEGFGYDPLFFYAPTGLTFAEMGADAKNAVSHRGRALAHLSRCLLQVIGVGT